MRRIWITHILGLATGVLAGCSDIQPMVTYPQQTPDRLNAEAEFEQEGLLLRLRDQDERIAAVAYRLSTANVALCTDRAAQLGWVLQSALQYGPRLRPVAQRLFHLDARPAVAAVVPGGPADKAGLRPGDVITAVDGQALPPAIAELERAPSSYAAVEALQARVGAAVANNAVRLTVQRDGQSRDLTLATVTGCAYDIQVMPSRDLNASADGRHVFVTTGLIRYVGASDDDLAVVLGHEYAHDVLQHKRRLDAKGIGRDIVGSLGSTPASLMTAEKEADYAGLYLTARAGYNIARGPEFWRQFAADYGDTAYASLTHPGSMERASALAATRDEIMRKLKAGEPIVPTLVRDARLSK